mgnify:CR=1 FL=1
MLNGSEIKVNGDSIDVMLKSKSKFMLEQKNANKTIIKPMPRPAPVANAISSSGMVKVKHALTIENKEETIVKNLMEENAKRALENASKPKQEKAPQGEGAPMKMGFANNSNENTKYCL